MYNPDDLSEEELLEILQAGGAQDQQSVLAQQLQLANKLRGFQAPEGRHAGGAYIAANPLEHIGAVLHAQRANREARDLQEQMARNQQRITDGKYRYWRGPSLPKVDPATFQQPPEFGKIMEGVPQTPVNISGQIAALRRGPQTGRRTMDPIEFIQRVANRTGPWNPLKVRLP